MTAPGEGVDFIARLFAQYRIIADDLAARPEVRRIEAPDFSERARRAGTCLRPVDWANEIFEGPGFRWAHVEFFSIPGQIGVLHVCLFPALDRRAPIFGFDIISGRAKATGAFLDLSPTTPSFDPIADAWMGSPPEAFAEPRTLPEWAAAIFSPRALAIRPVSVSEVDAVVALARRSLAFWLDAEKPSGSVAVMALAQYRYAAAQRLNEHTFRMLAGCVGPEIAREFIDDWLFPTPSADSESRPEISAPAIFRRN
jgi:phycocyanobilin:ferredoxin oxidoreductase